MDARRVACQRGFTLVEVMMACFILATGVLGAVGLIDNANKVTVKTKAREAAVSLDRQLIEGVRDIPYAQLTQSGLAADLQSQPGLSSEPGSSMYTIRRRGFAYSVDVATCEIDDPRDGIGPQSGGAFCGANYNPGGTGGSGGGSSTCSGAITGSGSGNVDVNGNKIDASFCLALSNSLIWSTCNLLNTSLSAQASGSLSAILGSALYAQAQAAASATVCGSSGGGGGGGGSAVAADTDPDDYRLVMTEVRWSTHNVRQATIIANPGSSAGPAVTNLQPTTGSTSVTVPSTTSVGFTATTSVTPAAVNWSQDGDTKGDASGSGTGPWAFTWALGPATDTSGGAVDPSTVLDGSYLIGARAYDNVGTTGPSRSVTMTINRSIPRRVEGVAAGRNGSIVDVEWQPNPERDIIGYRAYRINGGSTQLVCSLTQATKCQDTSPPSASTLYYYVVAVDRDTAGSPREGSSSSAAQIAVTQTNHPPNPPTNLLASTSSGTTILHWTAPLVQDPDLLLGDHIAFYRIYRDGSAYSNRYDRTGAGTDVTYTDTQTSGVPHTYYVTSVDTNLAESTLLGPVTK